MTMVLNMVKPNYYVCPDCGGKAYDLDCPDCGGSGDDGTGQDYCDSCSGSGTLDGDFECSECGNVYDESDVTFG